MNWAKSSDAGRFLHQCNVLRQVLSRLGIAYVNTTLANHTIASVHPYVINEEDYEDKDSKGNITKGSRFSAAFFECGVYLWFAYVFQRRYFKYAFSSYSLKLDKLQDLSNHLRSLRIDIGSDVKIMFNEGVKIVPSFVASIIRKSTVALSSILSREIHDLGVDLDSSEHAEIIVVTTNDSDGRISLYDLFIKIGDVFYSILGSIPVKSELPISGDPLLDRFFLSCDFCTLDELELEIDAMLAASSISTISDLKSMFGHESSGSGPTTNRGKVAVVATTTTETQETVEVSGTTSEEIKG
jgi:hypothetical protein